MEAKIVWLFIFVILYWIYCIYWGWRGSLMAKTASDYFIAGRRLSLWVFVLAATATSFSGWTFMGHPGLVYRDGFQYAYASFYTITIPFTGVMFLKRQWMLGKRFGYVTPGEMLATYFQGDMIRILTVLVALLYSIPYLGVQLGASGYLFNVLTIDDAYPKGMLSTEVGMWLLSIIVFIYVASGGLRAVAYVDTLQCILLAMGIVIYGFIALNAMGGWDHMQAGLAKLAASNVGKWGTTKGYGRSWQANPGRRSVDRRDVPDLHVRADGHPIRPGVHHVVVLQHGPAAVRAAAGVGVLFRDRLHPVLLHRLHGHGRPHVGRQPVGEQGGSGDCQRPSGYHREETGRLGALFAEPDRPHLALADRPGRGVRIGCHAVHGRRLHVDGGRHADA